MSQAIYPYKPLRALADNLWQVEGSLRLPVPRNMTIWRAPDGRLVLYSVVAMYEQGMRAVEALGTPAFMIIPHRRHRMDAPFYKARYPNIRVLAESAAVLEGGPAGLVIEGALAELRELGVRAERIPGTSSEDIAMDLPITGGQKGGQIGGEDRSEDRNLDAPRALCVCELLTNFEPAGALGKLAGRILGPPGGGVGISRVVRFREVVDRDVLRAWLTTKAERDDLRLLLVAHGAPTIGNVSDALRRAATQI
jgi:hypothetical protein